MAGMKQLVANVVAGVTPGQGCAPVHGVMVFDIFMEAARKAAQMAKAPERHKIVRAS